ncbi:MAG: CBS domain-containing protein, partial [Saprospiraceae bacterium]|nr:CBS domain-containing protein [Saprospiraceae bacterium]
MNPTDIRASDVMVKDLITLLVTDSMDMAEAIFSKHKIHHIPIVDKNGFLLGLVGTTDLDKVVHGKTLFKSQNVQAYNAALLRTLIVSEVMVTDPVVV